MSPRFRTDVWVEWGDVDLAGVVYFAQFFRYFGATESAFYRSLGLTLLELEESLGIRLPRIEAHCNYLRPARFGDLLNVSLEIERLSTKTVKYLFRVHCEEQAIATGHLVIASVSMHNFRAIPLPEDLRTLLQPFVSPSNEE